MPALPSSLISSLSQAPPITFPQTAAGLPAALAWLPDPRARCGVRHQLTVVVSAAVCARHAREVVMSRDEEDEPS